MRVLIVNKFYYPRGGDCVAAMNLERLLKDAGHDVAVFAMQYSENVETQWNGYYASSVDFTSGIVGKIKAAWRLLGLGDIKRSFSKILDDFKPEIVHLHNIHSYISPAVARLAKQRGCHVVWTMHDYKLVCPSYLCYYNGKPCEQCLGGRKMPVLANRCMKDSTAASALAWIEAVRWNRDKLNQITDAFICPSKFMASKMRKDGFEESKLHVVCNHIDPSKQQLFDTINPQREDYYAYVGRISVEKGVETLVSTASNLPHKLKVAGDGPLLQLLKEKYANATNIEFLGRINAEDVAILLSKARFSVMPSECYDNNPLGVIESLCAGTPVVGARIGGIPELLDKSNGMVFTAGNSDELSTCITKAFEVMWNHDKIKSAASAQFSARAHLDKILDVYNIFTQ